MKRINACLFSFILAVLGFATNAGAADKVSFSMSSTSMLNLPIYVADVMGYFQQHNIEPDIVKFHKGGATALAAVISRNSDIYIGSTGSAIRAVQNGTDAIIIGSVMSEISLNMVMSKKAADRLNISEKTPIAQRLLALKGLRIGVTGAGGATDQVAQHALRSAGLNPTRDATVAYVGSGADMLGALISGNVDVIIGANPTSDLATEKYNALLLIDGTRGEYPGLEGMAQLVAVTTKRWGTKNPDVAKRVMSAIGDAQLALRNPNVSKQARDLVFQKYFSNTEKTIFDVAWQHVIQAFPETPAFSTDQVVRNMHFLNSFSEIKYDVDPKRVYTNEFIAK